VPLITLEEVAKKTQLGLWKIEEDEAFFIKKLLLSEKEKSFLNGISSGKRYLHWLSSRVLIREALQTRDFIDLDFDEYGKPYFQNFPHYLSITHSHDYAGIIISENSNVGIDMERISPKIQDIAPKFMSEDELTALNSENKIEQLYAYWCAKEALYKLYGKKKLNFKQHILINKFKYSLKGRITASIRKEKFAKVYQVRYEKKDGYILAYVVE